MATESYTDFDVISNVGATANSYASVAYTKSLWSLDQFKKDYTFTDEDIGRAVISATKTFDKAYWNSYLGTMYSDDYALFFPRTGIYDSRKVAITDYTVFPSEVIEATAIQAYYLASSNRNAEVDPSLVKQMKMDGLGSKEYFNVGTQLNSKKDIIAEEASLIISPYVLSSGGKYSSLFLRG
jgi:hypothetical protein